MQLKKKKHIRRLFLLGLVLLTAMAQTVPWLPHWHDIFAVPLIPLVISIAALDQELSSLLLGLCAGVYWDAVSLGRGWHVLFLLLVSFASAMLLRYWFNRNWVTLLLLTSVSLFLYEFIRWLGHFHGAWRMLLRASLPSFCFSFLFLPVFYGLVQSIVRRTSKQLKGVRIG